jgi:hypothetical protein
VVTAVQTAPTKFEAYISEIMTNHRFVTKQKAKIALEGNIARAPGYAVLESEEKKEIHEHIAKIRSIIENSGLEDGKRNSLLDRLGQARSCCSIPRAGRSA